MVATIMIDEVVVFLSYGEDGCDGRITKKIDQAQDDPLDIIVHDDMIIENASFSPVALDFEHMPSNKPSGTPSTATNNNNKIIIKSNNNKRCNLPTYNNRSRRSSTRNLRTLKGCVAKILLTHPNLTSPCYSRVCSCFMNN